MNRHRASWWDNLSSYQLDGMRLCVFLHQRETVYDIPKIIVVSDSIKTFR